MDFQEEADPQLDHQEGEDQDITMAETEEQTSWWETLQRYSREYEQKLSLSLLFGGSVAVMPPRYN